MSATVSSASASASSSCTTADFTRFPTSDIACAVGSTTGVPSNTSDVFKSCCKSAAVESFNGACGYYCLSVQQTVAELQACFMNGGVRPGSIFCNGNNTASATGKGEASRTGGGAAATSAGGKPSEGVKRGVGLGVLGMVLMSVIAGAVL
jgi:hypothetical protein